MKNARHRIPLSEFDGVEVRNTDLSVYRYALIGLVEYASMGGQGDVEHLWVYLCKNTEGQPILITEAYDISWWAGPDPHNVSRNNLCELTEERLTQSEFLHYQSLAVSVGEGTFSLPITTNLPKLPLCRMTKPHTAKHSLD